MDLHSPAPEAASAAGIGRRRLLIAGGTSLLGGCLASNTLELPPDQWPVVELAPAEVVPDLTGDRLNRRTRVVVMEVADSSSAPRAGLNNFATAALEQVLGVAGVEIVDRKVASRLDQEIRLIETRGGASSSYNGPEIAEYAITVALGAASFGSQYVAASSYVDKKTGKPVVTPASHTHAGRSAMTLRIYELPSLRLVSSIPTEGSVALLSQQAPASPAQGADLMRAATESAVKDKRAEVLNEFAPKGYISERRAREKKSIFRALISRQTGAKKGDEVEIFSLRRSVDPLTKRTITDQSLVATGRVSDVVGEESSWVIVDDEKAAARVRRGDVIKVKHNMAWYEKIKLPGLPGLNKLGL